jgi:glycosyltransferase involved in cell wall biosynthesis
MRHAKGLGLTNILEQPSAPQEIEAGLLAGEWERFPDWEERPDSNGFVRLLGNQEWSEWDSADIVLCPSEFVRDGIASCGGPVDRCAVIPYGLDLTGRGHSFSDRVKRKRSGPLRVLTVGSVRLQKGPQYTLAAAKMLGGAAEFRIVGPLLVSEGARKELSRHIQLIGSVPRSEVARHYAWADVFLLPSVCEGFGLVLLEALAEGLPVVTTPNAGSVVRDDADGFVVPIRDPEAIADRLQRFVTDPSLLASMSANACERAEAFSICHYTGSLSGVIDSLNTPSRSVALKR